MHYVNEKQAFYREKKWWIFKKNFSQILTTSETKTVYVDVPAECPVVNCENSSENPDENSDNSNENSENPNENTKNPSGESDNPNPEPREIPDDSGENSNDPSENPEPVRGGGGEINA